MQKQFRGKMVNKPDNKVYPERSGTVRLLATGYPLIH